MAKSHQELARLSISALVQAVFERRTRPLIPLSYQDLARRVGHLSAVGDPVAVGMAEPLSVAGNLLQQLARQWNADVPHLTALVVAKETRTGLAADLPSGGMAEFWPTYEQMTRPERQRKVLAEWDRIATFGSRWNDVLRAFELPAIAPTRPPDYTINLIGIGRESAEHRALKAYVKDHPTCVGADDTYQCDIEYDLPSGDAIDVLFRSSDTWIAVEVKSRISDRCPTDYERGLYQTIKYGAVLSAMTQAELPEVPTRICSVLVLQSNLPRQYYALKQKLGITVYEQVGTDAPRT